MQIAPYTRTAPNPRQWKIVHDSSTAIRCKRKPSGSTLRPVKTFKQGGVQVSVWKNHTASGDMFNTTIRNSYKEEKSGDWKETTSFSPTDLAVVSQLASLAFQEIVQLKAQARAR